MPIILPHVLQIIRTLNYRVLNNATSHLREMLFLTKLSRFQHKDRLI